MRQVNTEEEFNKILYADKIDLEEKDKEFKKDGNVKDILLIFLKAPYLGLMDNIKNKLSDEYVEGYREDRLYMKHEDTGDVWEMGYIDMSLDFWKMIENVFINYKPKFYEIEEDGLREVYKIEYINTVRLKGSELDGYIE